MSNDLFLNLIVLQVYITSMFINNMQGNNAYQLNIKNCVIMQFILIAFDTCFILFINEVTDSYKVMTIQISGIFYYNQYIYSAF